MRKLVAMAVLLALAGCGGEATKTILTEADHGSRVEAGVGDLLEVRLPANPSTGFGWQATPTEGLVQVADPEFLTESSLIGAEGTEVFLFEVARNGEQALHMEYRRSFEEGSTESVFDIVVSAG
jgi:inhibitor of cysteine peptidase